MASAIGAVVGTIGSAVIGSRSSKKASEAASDAAERGQDILAEGRNQARDDIMRLFPDAQKAQSRGFMEAREMLGGLLPQQQRMFQEGNVGAQETLLAGLPQIQNAIMGSPVDLSGIQARTISPAALNVPTREVATTDKKITDEEIADALRKKVQQHFGLGGVGKIPQRNIRTWSSM